MQPVAGEPYTLDCIVNATNLSNADVWWVGPDNSIITSASGRVSVDDFVTNADGNSVRTLSFTALSTDDSGTYKCEFLNKSFVASKTLVIDGMFS